ncbi:hypothetical protein DENSPDRAFT_872744 [Dentipellis sp. KUC8613]|nr:hypothetical protein DENSPDRAFT_872744 [Dentipellis sp. KUC8613]
MAFMAEVDNIDNGSPLEGSIPIVPNDAPVGVDMSTASNGRDTERDHLSTVSSPSSIHLTSSASKVMAPSNTNVDNVVVDGVSCPVNRINNAGDTAPGSGSDHMPTGSPGSLSDAASQLLGHSAESGNGVDAESNNDKSLGPNEPAAEHRLPSGQKQKNRKMFGVSHKKQDTQYLNPDDYEKKYAMDEDGKCLEPNARVWKVYLDEAKVMDDDMVEAWKDTIDVLLVFAGLFSAVVTTFVVQSSQSLQPDYSQISAMLLTELVGLQRAMADGVSPSVVSVSQQNATSGFQVAASDQWVNRLWFISLSFSLATALISVLVKQWLQYYVSTVSGTSQEKAHIRHFRYIGLEKWHVSEIVGFLPIFMHIALLLFFIGLVLFLVPLDTVTASVTGILAALLYLL